MGKEHKHDWKFKGRNVLPAGINIKAGSTELGDTWVCWCGAVEFRGRGKSSEDSEK